VRSLWVTNGDMQSTVSRMPDLHIRDAQPTDSDAIREVTLAAYSEYAAHMEPTHWELYRENILATLADTSLAEQFVAQHDTTIIGTVLLYPPRDFNAAEHGIALQMPWPEVRLLAVVPAARGRGVGVALMHECVRRTRRSGIRMLSLHTTDFMQAAMRMYQRMGFVRAPALDFQPMPGVTIKGYCLDLSTA
jgi:GNAT superfamily N-acetyltransferase